MSEREFPRRKPVTEVVRAELPPVRKEVKRTVNVMALFPDRLIIRNAPTGTVYESPRGGTIIAVDSHDVDYILSLQRGPAGCCGSAGQGETRYFAPLEG